MVVNVLLVPVVAGAVVDRNTNDNGIFARYNTCTDFVIPNVNV